MHGLTLLSTLIWLPIGGGLLTLAIGDAHARVARWFALAVALMTLGLCVPLYQRFDNSTAAFQFLERLPWIPQLHADYYLGIDGIALPLIILTAFMTVPVLIAAWTVIDKRPAQYFAAFLVLEGLMIGVFCAMDALLFYFFWEAMLIPMFLIIGIWGGPRRVYATLKFFLYTFLGSVLMLVALIYLYLKAGEYGIAGFQSLPLTLIEQRWIFLAFLVAFAVKVPMWPVHTWLPDAHVEAPTGGSVILAAIMLKMGGYGLLRFSLPMTPDACRELDWLVIALSLIAVVYIGFVALAQTDMKKLIAYSSIAHMGFVTLGAFLVFDIVAATGGTSGAITGLDGAMVQMISHGLISGALFLCIGVLYDRLHSREISAYGGVINVMPRFAALMVFFALANSGLPGTSGFVGEFLVILASYKANFWYAFLAATTLILGAAYTLWLVKRVIFGPVGNDKVAAMSDLNGREFLVLGVLAATVLFVGLWPAPLVQTMEASVHHLLEQIVVSKIPVG
ncbi:MAG: NADH-quinone oxidoreductase subunit M [Steroidobacteraceae bacterium]